MKCWCTHIDTVLPFYPYSTHANQSLWGRGTVDAKGSIAAQIAALLSLPASHELPRATSPLLVFGEETGGAGMRHANALNLTWETVIFGEPTEPKLASGHKGNLGFHLMAKSKAGHSGYPWLGESANTMLVPVLLRLRELELPSSEKYGNSTLNIGRMEGGVAGGMCLRRGRVRV